MREQFEAWQADYGFWLEPNASKHTEADCWAAYQAGHAAARAEAEALLREALPHLHLCADLSLADRVNAYLAGGKT